MVTNQKRSSGVVQGVIAKGWMWAEQARRSGEKLVAKALLEFIRIVVTPTGPISHRRPPTRDEEQW